MEDFISGYIACALWCGVVDDEDNAEWDEDELTPKALETMRREASAFYENYHPLWDNAKNYSNDSAGHDFWLSRNRHGAGFWDRGLGEVGAKLHEAAVVYGEQNLVVNDEGKLEVVG